MGGCVSPRPATGLRLGFLPVMLTWENVGKQNLCFFYFAFTDQLSNQILTAMQ